MGLFAGTKWDLPPRCDRCERLESECECPPPEPMRIPPAKQTASIRTEKRGRGKTVTVIKGLPAEGNDLPDLLTQLKTRCGAGGSLHEEHLEIQGDHAEAIRKLLAEIGYRVK